MSYESGYYPAGAEHDSSAPWNERDNAPVKVAVEITMLVRKSVVVETEDYETDEDGFITDYGESVEELAKSRLTLPDGIELVEIEGVDY